MSDLTACKSKNVGIIAEMLGSRCYSTRQMRSVMFGLGCKSEVELNLPTPPDIRVFRNCLGDAVAVAE